jgi:hypothetical protein
MGIPLGLAPDPRPTWKAQGDAPASAGTGTPNASKQKGPRLAPARLAPSGIRPHSAWFRHTQVDVAPTATGSQLGGTLLCSRPP